MEKGRERKRSQVHMYPKQAKSRLKPTLTLARPERTRDQVGSTVRHKIGPRGSSRSRVVSWLCKLEGKEVVRANKAKSLLRFRNSGDCSGKQSKAHRAAAVCFAFHSKQSERLVGLLQKANKPKPLLLLHFQEQKVL